jgi:osmotically-inducible protein OsmY
MPKQNPYGRSRPDDRKPENETEKWDRKRWDRDHWERWMDTVRGNPRETADSGGVGGEFYQGGVYSSGTYGGGAEYYSITGMYENPLLEDWRGRHRGKGPREYTRTDERIYDEVCQHLTLHPLIDASLVDVKVDKGNVTLSGEIFDRRMKFLAEDLVDQVPGVRDIQNNLKVTRNHAA